MINHVPKEILCTTFSYFDVPTLGKAACVSKSWNLTAKTREIWIKLFFEDYPGIQLLNSEPQITYKFYYSFSKIPKKTKNVSRKFGFKSDVVVLQDQIIEISMVKKLIKLKNCIEPIINFFPTSICKKPLATCVFSEKWFILNSKGHLFVIDLLMHTTQLLFKITLEKAKYLLSATDSELILSVTSKICIFDLFTNRKLKTIKIMPLYDVRKIIQTKNFIFLLGFKAGNFFPQLFSIHKITLQMRRIYGIYPMDISSDHSYFCVCDAIVGVYIYKDTNDALDKIFHIEFPLINSNVELSASLALIGDYLIFHRNQEFILYNIPMKTKFTLGTGIKNKIEIIHLSGETGLYYRTHILFDSFAIYTKLDFFHRKLLG